MLKISLFCWNEGTSSSISHCTLIGLAGQDAQRFHARGTQRGLNHEIAFQIRQLRALQNVEILGARAIRVSPSIVGCSLETLNRAIADEVSGNTNQRMPAVASAATVPMQSASSQRRRRQLANELASIPPRSTSVAGSAGLAGRIDHGRRMAVGLGHQRGLGMLTADHRVG